MDTVSATELTNSLGMSYFRELATFGALSDKAITSLLEQGSIAKRARGETRAVRCAQVSDFYVVLQGDIAYYRHCEEHDVLTRNFRTGEQMGFDVMIGLRPEHGLEVAVEESIMLQISSHQFNEFRRFFPADFGLLMINLSRELSREIAMLEEVIRQCTGWRDVSLEKLE